MENIKFVLKYHPELLRTLFVLGGVIRYDQNRQKATIVGVFSWTVCGLKNGTHVYASNIHALGVHC